MEKFAKAEYKSYVLIDFNRSSKASMDLFEHYLNDLETLTILDEVQLFREYGRQSNIS
ncbi:MAG: hypothetical protein AB7C91_12845 [Sphaerochaeta sp.]|uniref:hypothetical protein n=1 Tax=Sphaerochaeta sp. TaxID=1972642 RepID=UPI003D142E63